jgi:adenylate kinase family enzyme
MPAEGPIELGRRIVVWGVTGSGKTTLAKCLSERLGLPRIELDAVFWRPGWEETPDDEFRAGVQTALDAAADGWVLDGHYRRISDTYLSRADTLIWIHLPWRTSFWRLLQRTFGRAWTRESLYYEGGPRESWRLSFFSRESILWWSITRHRYSIERRRESIAQMPPSIRVYELRSAREVDSLLNQSIVSHGV